MRSPRDTLYPFKHRNGPAANGFDTTYPKGGPRNPRAYVGNTVSLKFDLEAPIIGVGATANFSALYPGDEFTYGAENWLTVMDSGLALPPEYGVDVGANNKNFIITSVYVGVGTYVCHGPSVVNPGWEDVQVTLQSFNSGKTEAMTAAMQSSSSNTRVWYTVFDKTDFLKALTNNVPSVVSNADYPVLGLKVKNNSGTTATLAGNFVLYINGFEG